MLGRTVLAGFGSKAALTCNEDMYDDVAAGKWRCVAVENTGYAIPRNIMRENKP